MGKVIAIIAVVGCLGLIVLGVLGVFGFSMIAKSPEFKKAMEEAKDNRQTRTTSTTTFVGSSDLEETAYVDVDNGFSMHLPKNWTKTTAAGTLVAFRDPSETSTNINIGKGSNNGMTLTDYVAASSDQLSSVLPNYVSTESRRVTIGGVEGHILGGTFTISGVDMQNRQLILFDGDQSYIVTATTLTELWDDYEDIFDQSLLTFSF